MTELLADPIELDRGGTSSDGTRVFLALGQDYGTMREHLLGYLMAPTPFLEIGTSNRFFAKELAEFCLLVSSWEGELTSYQQGSTTNSDYATAQSFGADATERFGGSTEIELLRAAVEEDDVQAFAQVAEAIRWQDRSPRDYMTAIRSALSLGADEIARNLAKRGSEKFPEREDIKDAAFVLQEPQVKRWEARSASVTRNNTEWLRRHADEYKGRWVALSDGELVSSSISITGLKEDLSNEFKDYMITRISE